MRQVVWLSIVVCASCVSVCGLAHVLCGTVCSIMYECRPWAGHKQQSTCSDTMQAQPLPTWSVETLLWFPIHIIYYIYNVHTVKYSHHIAILCVQEKRAAAAKAQQLQQPQGGSGSTPASGAASPSPMETTPSGGVDRASSDAVAVAAAAMARTKSQGKANAIIVAVALAIDVVCNSSSHKAGISASCMMSQSAPMCSSPSICYIDL